MTPKSDKSRKVSGVIGVASVILVIAALLVGVVLQFAGNIGDAASASVKTQSNTGTVAFDPATDLVPDEARCVNNHFIKSSSQTVKAGDKNYRQFATAVSIPYTGVTDDAVSKETSTEVCGNPTELKMVVDDMMLWTGFSGANENKAWVKKIQDEINSKGLDSFVLKVKDTKQLIVTDEFQKYAGWVNTVLLRFNTNGEQSLTSVRNWEVPATSDPSTQPIAVQASDQESKPAWVRTLMDKNGKCLYKIGFNAEDKRIETFNCVVPKPPTTITPPCKTNCGHTTPPTCTVPLKCLASKDPSTDVGANPKVNPFLQDGGEKHSVSNGNGATVANGNQGSAANVAAAQAAAAAKAAADAAAAKAAQDAANQAANQSGGGQVDTNQNKGDSGGTPAGW